MNALLRLLALPAALLLAACGARVEGGEGDDGSGGSGASTGSETTGGGDTTMPGGGGTADPLPAVAMTRAQLDALWDEYWQTHGSGSSGSSSSSGGGNLDPNDLFIQLSDMGVSCDSPTVDLPCGVHWAVSISLPPAFQAVGVYDLESPGLVAYSYMNESGPANGPHPDDCSWGGGSLGPGTLEILAIDAQGVNFRLTMGDFVWESDPSGDYSAPRCL